MTARSKLLTLSERLGRVPSLGYAFVYLAAIPLFAAFYFVLPPHQFYHSTVQYEWYLQRDGDIALAELESAVKDNMASVAGSSVIADREWHVDASKVSLGGLVIKDKKFELSAWVTFESSKVIEPIHIDLQFSLGHPLSMNPKDGKREFWICEKQAADYQYKVRFDKLFPFNARFSDYSVGYNDARKCGFIVISTQVEGHLRAYMDGMRGFPSFSSGNYERMFYLSAITIATVGYGDIVPITPLARMAVSVEAILGIVLMGLFLNALAHESKNRT